MALILGTPRKGKHDHYGTISSPVFAGASVPAKCPHRQPCADALAQVHAEDKEGVLFDEQPGDVTSLGDTPIPLSPADKPPCLPANQNSPLVGAFPFGSSEGDERTQGRV